MKTNKLHLLIILLLISCIKIFPQKTTVGIINDQFYINGKPTYQGKYWQNHKIEGLLINSRMLQGVFDDLNPGVSLDGQLMKPYMNRLDNILKKADELNIGRYSGSFLLRTRPIPN